MKYRLISFLNIMILLCIIGCKQTEKKYYENGKLLSETTYNKNREIIGTYIEYFPSGQKKFIFEYRNGHRDGLMIQYYDNGNYELISHLKNGKRNGMQLEYDINGNLLNYAEYKNDSLNGKFIKFYTNGQLNESENYVMGKFEGESMEFSLDGKIASKFYYSNGLKMYHYLYDNGILKKAYKINNLLVALQIHPLLDTIRVGESINFKLEYSSVSPTKVEDIRCYLINLSNADTTDVNPTKEGLYNLSNLMKGNYVLNVDATVTENNKFKGFTFVEKAILVE